MNDLKVAGGESSGSGTLRGQLPARQRRSPASATPRSAQVGRYWAAPISLSHGARMSKERNIRYTHKQDPEEVPNPSLREMSEPL